MLALMNMDSMNISLPPAMAEFVRRQVDQDYGNVSEYFRDLVRERIKREVDADLAFLESTGQGALPGPTEKEIEEVLAVQMRVRKARNARRV
jgi:Arc/MetJ-type ribon-helix-helix transcriptional regulator